MNKTRKRIDILKTLMFYKQNVSSARKKAFDNEWYKKPIKVRTVEEADAWYTANCTDNEDENGDPIVWSRNDYYRDMDDFMYDFM